MKLTDIKTRDILFKATEWDIQRIVFEEENNTIEQPCDIGFVFGGVSMIPYRVERAIELYRSNLINKIIVTGGIGYLNKDRKIPEGYKLFDYLVNSGIPVKDIFVEAESRDSRENIKNALEIISDSYDVYSTTFALITSDFHLRRCLGLFTNTLGSSENLFGSGVTDGKTDIESWNQTFAGKKQIYTEAMLLTSYARSGQIPNYEIEGLSLSRKK